jgi:hypothetical protein
MEHGFFFFIHLIVMAPKNWTQGKGRSKIT